MFDSQVFAEQARGGVSRYFLALAEHLSHATDWEAHLYLGLHIGHGGARAAKFGPHLRVPAVPHSFRVKRWLNRQVMRGFSPRDDGKTVYHPTWYDQPTLAAWGRLPLVLTVHDLIPESWPEVTTPRQLADRRAALGRARQIICVSESTRDRLIDHYPDTAERVRVVYHGLHPLPPLSGPSGYKGDFFVHVGKRGAYKDFSTLAHALVHSPQTVKVVAVGGGSATPEEQALLDDLGVRARVDFEPSASDQRLADILGDSRGLISTSRDEGFGLPPLEALGSGKPVLLSGIPVHRELYSRWARFFVPGDAVSLAEAIAASLAGPPTPPSLPDLQSTFSWVRAAKQTAQVYAQALD